MYKNADGVYETDVRVKGVARLHLSLRTKKKAEAEEAEAAVKRLFREAKGPNAGPRLALIEQLRDSSLSIERLVAMVRNHEPLEPEAPAEPLASGTAAAWPTVDEATTKYVAWLEANPKRRRSTWAQAKTLLKYFGDFEFEGVRTGDRRMDDVPSRLIEAYQQSLIAGGAPDNSVTTRMMRVGALWTWQQRREARSAIEDRRSATLLHSPIDPETVSHEKSSRDRWLTYDEAERLLAATPERLLFPVAVGLFAGLRVGEMLHLRPANDVDLELGILSIQKQQYWRPKTDRAVRVVPIAPPLKPIIEQHLDRYASDDWMLPALDDPSQPFAYATFHAHFEQIVRDAELVVGRKDPRGVVFHTLRHTFASWLVMRGVDLYTVAQLLGDTLQMVEETYAHLAPDFKKRAIAALEGAIEMPGASGPALKSPELATANATTEGSIT